MAAIWMLLDKHQSRGEAWKVNFFVRCRDMQSPKHPQLLWKSKVKVNENEKRASCGFIVNFSKSNVELNAEGKKCSWWTMNEVWILNFGWNGKLFAAWRMYRDGGGATTDRKSFRALRADKNLTWRQKIATVFRELEQQQQPTGTAQKEIECEARSCDRWVGGDERWFSLKIH